MDSNNRKIMVELPNFEEWFEQNKPIDFYQYDGRYRNGFETGARRLWNSLMKDKVKQWMQYNNGLNN